MLDVNSLQTYLRDLNSRDDTQSSNDSVSSSFIKWERALGAEERLLSKLQTLLQELERREAAPIQKNLPDWDPAQKGNSDTCDEIAPHQPL